MIKNFDVLLELLTGLCDLGTNENWTVRSRKHQELSPSGSTQKAQESIVNFRFWRKTRI
jgi:hypothetical protein